jgi:hypothetical protein
MRGFRAVELHQRAFKHKRQLEPQIVWAVDTRRLEKREGACERRPGGLCGLWGVVGNVGVEHDQELAGVCGAFCAHALRACVFFEVFDHPVGRDIDLGEEEHTRHGKDEKGFVCVDGRM